MYDHTKYVSSIEFLLLHWMNCILFRTMYVYKYIPNPPRTPLTWWRLQVEIMKYYPLYSTPQTVYVRRRDLLDQNRQDKHWAHKPFAWNRKAPVCLTLHLAFTFIVHKPYSSSAYKYYSTTRFTSRYIVNKCTPSHSWRYY